MSLPSPPRLEQESLDASPAGVLIFDAEERITYANPAAARILRIPRERLMGLRHADGAWITRDERGQSIAHENSIVRRVLAGETTPQGLTRQLVPAQGAFSPRTVKVSASAMHADSGPPSGVLLFLHDVTEQHEAQQAATIAQERYRALFDHANVGCFVCDEKGGPLEVNQEALRIMGMSREELLGAPSVAEQTYTPESLSHALEALEVARRDGQVRANLEVEHRNGRRLPVEVIATKLASGLLVGTIRDLTMERASVARRKDELERLSLVLDGVDSVVYVSDLETHELLFLNEAGRRHTGVPDAWAGGKCWALLQQGQEGPCAFCNNDRLIDEQGRPTGPVVWEFQNTRDGKWYLCRDEAITWSDGRLVRLEVATCIDEQKRAQETTDRASRLARLVGEFASHFIGLGPQSLQSRLEQALGSIGAFLAVDAVLHFESDDSEIPPGYRLIHAWSTHEVDLLPARLDRIPAPWCQERLGRAEIVRITDLETTEVQDAGFVTTLRELGLRAAEWVPLFFEGELRGFLLLAARHPLQHEGEAFPSVMRLLGSVLANARARTVAELARSELEQHLRHAHKMEATGQLAAGVAHDFNNLLQAIGGYTDLALASASAPDADSLTEIPPLLEEVSRGVERAASLTRQLLAFSRREPTLPEPVSLGSIVRETADVVRRLVGGGIEVEIVTPDVPDVIHADAGEIEQLLLNLCLNAREAMKEDGMLRIEVSEVPVLDDRHGERISLIVQDTGVGIPEGIRDRIFEPFFTTKPAGRGSGLGLAAVYAITERHGARIEFESTLGQGTRFEIGFPRHEEAAPPRREAPGASSPAPRSGARQRVLLAEDDDLVRELSRRVLERAGFEVAVARDGREALALVQERPDGFDLAVLDMVMPGADGRAVHNLLQECSPACRVLFVSGYLYEGLAEDGLPEGAEFLPKPFPPATLLDRLRQLAPARRR